MERVKKSRGEGRVSGEPVDRLLVDDIPFAQYFG